MRVSCARPIANGHIGGGTDIFYSAVLVRNVLTGSNRCAFRTAPIDSARSINRGLRMETSTLPIRPIIGRVASGVLLDGSGLFYGGPSPSRKGCVRCLISNGCAGFFRAS